MGGFSIAMLIYKRVCLLTKKIQQIDEYHMIIYEIHVWMSMFVLQIYAG